MIIEIDSYSGFCYGVINTIDLAEKLLKQNKQVYCLGEIVHNPEEVKRLKSMGIIFIDHKDLHEIHNSSILIRAHGEPSATYELIARNNNELFDGTCPIVRILQKKVKEVSLEMKNVNGQVVLFGKKDHAEVIGITGQSIENILVVNALSDLEQIDFSRPVYLFSQTTQPEEAFHQIGAIIRQRMSEHYPDGKIPLKITDSICRHVSKRGEHLAGFAKKHDTLIFISGKNSSNGKILFDVCKKGSKNAYWVSNANELEKEWFVHALSVGICGATSTPRWQLEEASEKILGLKTEIS